MASLIIVGILLFIGGLVSGFIFNRHINKVNKTILINKIVKTGKCLIEDKDISIEFCNPKVIKLHNVGM